MKIARLAAIFSVACPHFHGRLAAKPQFSRPAVGLAYKSRLRGSNICAEADSALVSCMLMRVGRRTTLWQALSDRNHDTAGRE